MVSTQSKTIVLGVRVTEKMYHELGELSLQEEESMASIIRTAIKQYLRFRVRGGEGGPVLSDQYQRVLKASGKHV